MCQMFSSSSASFSDKGTCNKCSLFVVLEARLSELEARLCTVENHPIASQAPLASAEPPTVASSISRPVADPEQLGPDDKLKVYWSHDLQAQGDVMDYWGLLKI